jgi:hypothetical protein
MAVVPFEASEASESGHAGPKWMDLNDDQVYHAQWLIWRNGKEHEQGAARHYFWNAFLSSQLVETATEAEDLGGGNARYNQEQVRKAHIFLRGVLASSDEIDFDRALSLISSCRSGDPYMLADILAAYAASAPSERFNGICYTLGEIASWPHDRVRRLLGHLITTTLDGNVHLHATLAFYKIFLRTEGIQRINQKRSSGSYDETIAPMLSGLNQQSRMLFLISFASQFCHHGLSHCCKPLAEEYRRLQVAIEEQAKVVFTAEQHQTISTLLDQLLGTHDYVGLCVLFGMQLRTNGNEDFANLLLSAACSVIVVAAQHDQATRHLAMAFYLQKDLRNAHEVAEGLAKRNPDNVSLQVLTLQILAEMKSIETLPRITALRARYRLTNIEEETLADLERYLTQSS